MKMKFLLSIILIAAIFASCKKDGVITSGTLTVLIKDSTYDSNSTNSQVRTFLYNTSNQLIKVSYSSGGSSTAYKYDTLVYTSGKLHEVLNYDISGPTLTGTTIFNYTGNLISSTDETGNNGSPYTLTRTYGYTNNKLDSFTTVYSVGSGGGGNPDNIDSIVYSGNDFSTANLVGQGRVTLTFDAAPNPYYGLYLKGGDFINLFNPNNIITAYKTAVPSNIFELDTYEYVGGKVSRVHDLKNNTTNTLTYGDL